MAERHLLQAAEAEQPASGVARRRILVVEDQSIVAFEYFDELEAAGFEPVGPAADLEEALGLFESDKIDAAILDVWLDERSVWPLADQLMRRGIPFILVSGYCGNSGIPDRFSTITCLRKPISGSQVARSVASLFQAAPAD